MWLRICLTELWKNGVEVKLFGLRVKKYKGIIFVTVLVLIIGVCVVLFVSKKRGEDEQEGNEMQVYVLSTSVKEDDLVEGTFVLRNVGKDLLPEDVCMYEDLTDECKYKLDLKPGTILSKSMIYEGQKVADDVRLHNYPYIKLTDKIEVGDYVDIRISFSNGADYILLSKKKVVDFSLYNEETMTENALWMYVNEEEILRLSGAVVDASMSDGCSIYAIKYVEGYQNKPQVTYPISALIQSLIENNPNIVESAQKEIVTEMREPVEELFEKEDDETVNNETMNNSEEDSLIYEKPQENEIIYFD